MKELSPKARMYLQQHIELAHAMQTGVAMMQQLSGEPEAQAIQQGDLSRLAKHLRVGINSALVDISSIAWLLVEKGIITDVELCKALYEGMLREVKTYETQLGAKLV